MGNCVGHSVSKTSNDNDLHTNSTVTKHPETALSNKSRQTNNEQSTSGVTASKNNQTGNKRQEKTMFEEQEQVEEPIAENYKDLLPNEPVADNTKNQETPQSDKISSDCKAETNSGKDAQNRDTTQRTDITNDDPRHQDSLPSHAIETNKKISTNEQSLMESERKTSKCCPDRNDIETTEDNVEFKRTTIGDKISNEPAADCKTRSSDSIDTTDNMERSSFTSCKSFIESDEDEGSFEKIVLSPCYSENVRKAFVALSKDFINIQEDVKCSTNNNELDTVTELSDKGQSLHEEVPSFTGCVANNENADLSKHSNYDFIAPDANVGESSTIKNDDDLDLVEEHTDKKQESNDKTAFTPCFSKNERNGTCHLSSDSIDREKNAEKSSTKNDNELDVVEENNEKKQQSNDKNQCFSKNESNGTCQLSNDSHHEPDENVGKSLSTNENDSSVVENLTDDSQTLNEETTQCFPEDKEKELDKIGAEPTECSKTTKMETGVDIAEAAAEGQLSPSSACSRSAQLSMGIVASEDYPKRATKGRDGVTDKEQPLHEKSVFTGCTEWEKNGVLKRNSIDSDANIDDNELQVVEDVSDKGLSLDEISVYTASEAERNQTGVRKHSTDIIDLEDNLVSPTTNNNEVDIVEDVCDKGLSLDEDSFDTRCCSEREETCFRKHSTGFVDLENNLVSSHTKKEIELAMDESVSNKEQSLDEDSVVTDSCSEKGFRENRTDFIDVEDNLVSSHTKKEIELAMVESVSDKGQSLPDEDSVVANSCSESEFSKHSTDLFDVHTSLVSSPTAIELDIVENLEQPFLEDSVITTSCLENERTETGSSGHEEDTNAGAFESLNLDQKTGCVDETICEDSASGRELCENLSYCKIDKKETCECFEQVGIDCCCQCCDCTGNHS